MKHIMIDLETMSCEADAAIVAIGAVKFDPVKGVVGESFYTVVDLGSSVVNGGQIGADTVMWWMMQSEEARKALCAETRNIGTVLAELSGWMGDRKETVVWGNGAAFDLPILSSAFRRMKMVEPWRHYNERCYRTISKLFPNIPKPDFAGVKHNAEDDARNQAIHVCEIFDACRRLGTGLAA